MFGAGLIDWIPESFREKVADAVVNFIGEQTKKYLGDEVAGRIKKLRSDAGFQQAFAQGLQRAARRFFEEYEAQDEDLTAALRDAPEFFENEDVQAALLKILKNPGAYLTDERAVVAQSFDSVLPTRKNRERVDKAVTFFLRCLAEEVCHLPELQPIYSFQFQRMTAEALRQQADMQRVQLQALTGLNADMRDALLQLTEKLVEQKALPGGAFMLSERPKVYHNLPQPDYGNFVGREAELKKITDILRPYPHSQHALVTIDGIGGIGKSALALEIGHRFLRNFDDLPPEDRFEAIIWASAKLTILTAEGISTRRQILRTLDDIYNALAVGLQREDITRARKEDQDEVVRNALTRQRTLLIVDNLETVDDEAVLTFLRELPAPTKAIVTTRHRLDVAYPVRLTGMPLDDAQQLIRQECAKKGVTFSDQPQRRGDAEQENYVQRLFERTGGVPLAIVWSIAQMGFGYGVEAVLHRLGQPTGDISRFCFEGAVERISGKPAHKLLMVLSLCAESASRESLGYATELAEFDRDDGLVELEKLSLVNKSGDRFWLLPLTKQYAAAEFEKSAEKEQLREKWIEYFRITGEKYSGEHGDWALNYDWLLTEGENIISIVNWALINTVGGKALLFIRQILRYLDIKGRWSELSEYGERFYNLAQALNEKPTWAWICNHWLAWLYAVQGNFDKSEKTAREALSLYSDIKDLHGICYALRNVGRALRRAKKYERAEEMCKQAMELAYKYNFDDAFLWVYFELSRLKRDCGELEEAKKYCQVIIDWFEEHKNETILDITFLMGTIGNLGWIEFMMGNFHQAKELIEKCLLSIEHIGGKGQIVVLHLRLIAVEKALDNNKKALHHAQEAAFWAERLGMVRELEGAKALLRELNAENPSTQGTE